MDADEFNRVRDLLSARRIELREDVVLALEARRHAQQELILNTCRAAGASARSHGLARETNPFTRLLHSQGIGVVTPEAWSARSDAWFSGWDAAGAPDPA